VTLVKKNDDVWCVAQGAAATSALAWTPMRDGLQRGGKNTFFISSFVLSKLLKDNFRFYASAC
jgi:hypothetical protein